MPGYPGMRLKKASKEDKEMKSNKYQSITCKLMYYMVKVAPEIVNAKREIAGQMIKPSKSHWTKVIQKGQLDMYSMNHTRRNQEGHYPDKK